MIKGLDTTNFAKFMLCYPGVEFILGQSFLAFDEMEIRLWYNKMQIFLHVAYATVAVPHNKMSGSSRAEYHGFTVAATIVLLCRLRLSSSGVQEKR